MTTPALKSLVLLAALAAAPVAGAQQKQKTPELREVPSEPQQAPEPAVIPELAFHQATLKDAVALLSDMMQERNEMSNIILEPGTGNAPPVTLSLRNVRTSDALQLVAMAANCRFERVYSEDRRSDGEDPFSGRPTERPLIAYRITPDPEKATVAAVDATAPAAPSPPPGGPTGATTVPGAGSGFGQQITIAEPVPGYGPRHPRVLAGLASPGSPDGGPGGGPMVSPGEPATRIYPVGDTSLGSDFKTFETVILDVFKTAGIEADNVRLSWHEGAKILILRGPEQAHSLIVSLIESLTHNEDPNDPLALKNQELARLSMEKAMQEDAKVRLAEQIARLEDEHRYSQRENIELREQLRLATEALKAKSDSAKEE